MCLILFVDLEKCKGCQKGPTAWKVSVSVDGKLLLFCFARWMELVYLRWCLELGISDLAKVQVSAF